MKETILLAPGANGTELLRMLARFGKNTLGLRVMNAVELSKYALMYCGIPIGADFLPRKQEPAVVDSFIRQIPYFASASYADSEKVADALFSLRSLIPLDEFKRIHTVLPKGEFQDKNSSLEKAYDQYFASLKRNGMIDTIGLIRKAMAEAAPLACPIYILKEYPLSPLETALAGTLVPDCTETTLPELLGQKALQLSNLDYWECYGSSNEVEAVYDYIASHKIPFDQCTVAITNTAQYSQLFYDFAQSHNIPVTLGCGIPILNSNPAKLLRLLYDWNTPGYNGADALRELLTSDAFDRKKLYTALGMENAGYLNEIIAMAGALRIGFQKQVNDTRINAYRQTLEPGSDAQKILGYVESLSAEFSQGQSRLIEKFSVIRDHIPGRVDRSALSVVCGTLDAYAHFSDGNTLDSIIPEILQKSVCSENSRGGALFITGIPGALASMREHLFVVGLSASYFPGTPRENYLLLDSDYALFGDVQTLPTSTNRVARQKESLDNLLTLASTMGVQSHISYASYHLTDLKEENPSSVLFDLFRRQHGKSATLQEFRSSLRPIGYFDQQVSDSRYVGRAYVDGMEILHEEMRGDDTPCPVAVQTGFSPTAIDDFFSCPRHFFLTRILGVKETEADDPFVVISPAALGTLVHALMEQLGSTPCNREEFLQHADAVFEQFLLSRPPIHKDSAAAEKKAFLNIMRNAFDSDPGNEVLASEEDASILHSSGVPLCGVPDRVEKTSEGAYIIADYKTGRKIRHKPNDIHTCLQVVIYAYLLEQHGIPISRCEYRYLRDRLTVECNYDSAMKQALNAKMLEFKNTLDTGIFPPARTEDACKFCTLQVICREENTLHEEAAK